MPAPTALPTGTFGHHIREERERRGWTQTELGEKTGLGQSGVSRIENGKIPDMEDVELLAQGFDVTARTVAGWWYSARRNAVRGSFHHRRFGVAHPHLTGLSRSRSPHAILAAA